MGIKGHLTEHLSKQLNQTDTVKLSVYLGHIEYLQASLFAILSDIILKFCNQKGYIFIYRKHTNVGTSGRWVSFSKENKEL